MTVTIYHNPRCSKSRETLKLLQEAGTEIDIIEYLKTPPTIEQLSRIISKLGITPRELLRKTEPEYKQLELNSDKRSDDELIEVMVAHPKLIERPIVVKGDNAVIGRPPENIKSIL